MAAAVMAGPVIRTVTRATLIPEVAVVVLGTALLVPVQGVLAAAAS
jgi:hypothetical protein